MGLKDASIGLVLLLFCCFPQAVDAEEYTLSDLYRIALEKSEKIQIARENVTFTELEKNRAVAMLMPKLTAFGTYQRYRDAKYNDYDSLIQPKNSEQWGVRADQTMSLSLREFTALSEAKNDIRRAGYDLSYLRESYLLQVAGAYYNVLMAGKALDIASSNLDRVTKYRNAAQARLKVGEVTKTVLLRAESELSSAKSDMVKARNSLALAESTLARVVGIAGGYTLREEAPREAPASTLEDLKSLAFAERPDLKSLEYQVTIARQEVSYARGAYWPNLLVAGVYQKADMNPETLSLVKETSYGSVSLSFPFFEGGLRRAEVQEARVRERQAVLQYEDQKKNVGMDVERAYLDLTTQKGTLKFLEDQVAFARDNYRGVSRQFELGLASSIDLIDANNLLVSSERSLAEAIYSYQLAILAMEQATGTFMKGINQTVKR